MKENVSGCFFLNTVYINSANIQLFLTSSFPSYSRRVFKSSHYLCYTVMLYLAGLSGITASLFTVHTNQLPMTVCVQLPGHTG